MICLDADLARTRFDAIRQSCFYTIAKGERHWTVEIPLAKLNVHAGNKMMRRKTVEQFLQQAMNGPADGES